MSTPHSTAVLGEVATCRPIARTESQRRGFVIWRGLPEVPRRGTRTTLALAPKGGGPGPKEAGSHGGKIPPGSRSGMAMEGEGMVPAASI